MHSRASHIFPGRFVRLVGLWAVLLPVLAAVTAAQTTPAVDVLLRPVVQDDRLAVTVRIASEPAEGLGVATVVLSFNPDALALPLESTGVTLQDSIDYTFQNGFGADCYDASTVTRPQTGEVSINVDYSYAEVFGFCGVDGGAEIPEAGIDLVTIYFQGTDPQAPAQLAPDPSLEVTALFADDDDTEPTRFAHGAFEPASSAVDLVGFEAQGGTGRAVLSWTTSGEFNNAGFETQHRASGATAWETADFVAGAGTTGQEQYYQFTIPDLAPGVHHVRLRQVGHDGAEAFSDALEITIGAANGAPVAADDATATTSGTPVEIGVLANDGDPDGDPLSITAITEAAEHGTAEVFAGGQAVRYAPEAGFSGTDTFRYQISDGALTAEATVTVTVDATNRAPVAAADTAATAEDQPFIIDVLANDADPDGDPLSITQVTAPAHGIAEVDDDRRLRYTPEADFFGTDAFVYRIRDGQGMTAEASVFVEVTAVNDPPTPPPLTAPEGGAEIAVPLDEPLAVTWAEASDPDGDAVAYTWQLAPTEAFDAPALSIEAGSATRLTIAPETLIEMLDAQGVRAGDTRTFWHRVQAADGTLATPSPARRLVFTRDAATDAETGTALPERFGLQGNYPNPFNPSTTIVFDLPEAAEVRLHVFDLLGRQVLALPPKSVAAGADRTLQVEAGALSSGTYLYQLVMHAPDGTHVRNGRMTLIR